MKMVSGTIQEKIGAYCMEGKSYHRYRSWEHCYRYFHSMPCEAIYEDRHNAALRLGFYLASWGMYRGSSFLLQHDYMIHLGVVDKLVGSQFSPLWQQEFGDSDNDMQLVPLILDAVNAVREAYRPFAPPTEDRQASDTLVTKVLLGTTGCLPACDRFFIAGFKHLGFQYSYVNRKFIERVLDFGQRHRLELRAEQLRIESTSAMRYPLMKLIDMCFWQIGADASAATDVRDAVRRRVQAAVFELDRNYKK